MRNGAAPDEAGAYRAGRCWAGVLTEERYATERLYARDAIMFDLGAATAGDAPSTGDPVLLIAATDPPVLFGVGRVATRGADRSGGSVAVAYTERLIDDPPAVDLRVTPGLVPIDTAEFARLAAPARTRPRAGASQWFVSVTLPIEAASRAEAVREFWTYIDKLGPRELPAFVWPRGDELAMQAFVLGAEANLDPEEDDDDSPGRDHPA